MLTTTPPSNMHPTIVVPVLVAFGKGTPLACNAALRVWLEKSKPGMLANGAYQAPVPIVLVNAVSILTDNHQDTSWRGRGGGCEADEL